MVCYARPAGLMAVVVVVVLLVFGQPVSHFFDTAALMLAITVAAGGAAVAAALAFAAFLSVRRRRAMAGGCVNCQFRCQHAMTEQPRRLVMSTVERAPAPPRWPDRPAYRSGPASGRHRGVSGFQRSLPWHRTPLGEEGAGVWASGWAAW
jgi:hypothetical protein